MKFSFPLLALLATATAALATPDLKPRVIVLTDVKRFQETDDSQSIVRLLAHADLVEIEGIVVSSGHNYWEPHHAIDGYEYSFELARGYERSVSNLMKMSAQTGFKPVEERQEIGYWPSPHYVLQRLALGTPLQGLDQTGPGRDNPGSRLIASVVDENDPRPVYVLAYGGANVLAQTLRDVAENPATRRSPEAVAAFVRKLRVIAVADQDQKWPERALPPTPNNAGRWLRDTYPELSWLLIDGHGFHQLKAMQPFYQAHIQGHGALGDLYPDHHYSCEGDTPALFHVLPLGLGDPAHPEGGSLAGTHQLGWNEALRAKVWSRLPPDDPAAAYSNDLGRRCAEALWRLFAARMDWARSGTGNRLARPIVDGDATRQLLHREAAPGTTVTFDASGSTDGENDKLTFAWEQMLLPNVYVRPVALEGAATAKVSLTIPSDAAGQDIHLLLTVNDHGAGHNLAAWRHVILHVK